jgi:hypothetical protein
MPVESSGAKLSFVLPVAISDTGRPGDDLRRMQLLLESFIRCFPRQDIAGFLVIAKPDEMSSVGRLTHRVWGRRVRGRRGGDADMSGAGKRPRHQPRVSHTEQGLVPAAASQAGCREACPQPFLHDARLGVIFAKEFRADDVIVEGRSIVNIQTEHDYPALFTDQARTERRTSDRPRLEGAANCWVCRVLTPVSTVRHLSFSAPISRAGCFSTSRSATDGLVPAR